MPRTRILSIIGGVAVATLALALIAASCSGGDDAASTTTTTAAPTTTTTAATTTTAEPTTTDPGATIAVNVTEAPDDLQQLLAEFYSWVGDRRLSPPELPEGLEEHLEGALPESDMTISATLHTAEVEPGIAAGVVASEEGDVVLVSYDGSDWSIHGAHLESIGADPWFGPPVRHVLIIGTDARTGQDQQNFRADSIHIVSSNLSEGGGAIIGFPRDSYVPASYGNDKFTHVNVRDGPGGMVTAAETVSELEIEGYFVTGFDGFVRLVNDFGGVMVDVPFAMAEPKSKAYLSAGLQLLRGQDTLAFTRNRTIPGSDFTRSFHHGVVIIGTLQGVLERDLTTLPRLLSILYQYTWTDLPVGDVLALGATAFYTDPGLVENVVLDGRVGSAGGASVVFLDEEENAAVFEDVAEDGMLEPDDED